MQEIFLWARNLHIVQFCLILGLQKDYQALWSMHWQRCFWHLLRFVKNSLLFIVKMLFLLFSLHEWKTDLTNDFIMIDLHFLCICKLVSQRENSNAVLGLSFTMIRKHCMHRWERSLLTCINAIIVLSNSLYQGL